MLKGEAGPHGNAGEGVVGHVARDPRHLHEQVWQMAQHRPPTREDHALVNDV